MLNVTCVNVNYFTNGTYNPNNEQVEQGARATVSFAPVSGESGTNPIESFTLTFNSVEGDLGYFPGREYELDIKPVVQD